MMETTSYDTIGNAYFVRTQICDHMNWDTIWVTTSAFHMPRSKAIFDWIFGAKGGANQTPYRLRYFQTDNQGITKEGVAAREEREAKSLIGVKKLSKIHTSLKSVLCFLMRDHRMYNVKGLDTQEKISEDLKKSY